MRAKLRSEYGHVAVPLARLLCGSLITGASHHDGDNPRRSIADGLGDQVLVGGPMRNLFWWPVNVG